MDMTFESLLFSDKGLNKQKGAKESAVSDAYPEMDKLRNEIKDFDTRFLVRYNSNSSFSYGGVSEKGNKRVIAITRTKNGDIAARVRDDYIKVRTWSLDNKKRDALGFKPIDELIEEIKNG